MKKKRFITGYSGLRTLAVLGVILYHLEPNTFIGGYLGVPIFLVLTGYLITGQVMRGMAEGGFDFKGYYLKRIKRLYPQLIAMLWMTSAYICLFQRNLLAKLNQIVLANLLNVYNWWQIFNGQSYFERFASNESPFTHLWTMSLEGQFYILWPVIFCLIVRLAKKRKYVFWTLIGLSIISALEMGILFKAGQDTSRIYYGTDTRFFSLGLGAALAVYWPIYDLEENVGWETKAILDGAGLVSLSGMLLMSFSKIMDPQGAFPYRLGMLLFTVLTVILVAVIAHPASHWNFILTNPVFDWVGSRSYGIYLYQFPVMIFFEDKMPNLADHVLLYHIIEVALILALSEVTYRLIEKPFGKITWHEFKAKIEHILSGFKKKDKWTEYLPQAQFIFTIFILLIGSLGIIQSRGVKADNANHSELAETIEKNGKKQSEDNAKQIEKIRQEKIKEKEQSTNSSAKESAENKSSKKNSVNAEFEKYGINQTELQLAQKLPLTAVGDSVMAGSSNNLKNLLPNSVIDAAVSRQVSAAQNILEKYKEKGVLQKNILIGLGTNGNIAMPQVDSLMKLAGKRREVFWINNRVPNRVWQNPNNDLLCEAAKKYRNFTVIDWHSYSDGHPDWFYKDNTHPNVVGSKYYSSFIAKELVKNIYHK